MFIVDLLVPSRRLARFGYVKKVDAWSTQILFDWAAVLVVEIIIKYGKGKIVPDQLTALSILFYFSGLGILIALNCPLCAAPFFFASIVADCSDGKLARALQLRTRHGVFADAIADLLIHGFGFCVIALWLLVQHDNLIGAICVFVIAVYMTMAHVNNISVGLGVKARGANSDAVFNILSEIELCFLVIPFVIVLFPGEKFIAPTALLVFVLMKIASRR